MWHEVFWKMQCLWMHASITFFKTSIIDFSPQCLAGTHQVLWDFILFYFIFKGWQFLHRVMPKGAPHSGPPCAPLILSKVHPMGPSPTHKALWEISECTLYTWINIPLRKQEEIYAYSVRVKVKTHLLVSVRILPFLRSRCKNPPLCGPCNLPMFRFTITVALCF